MYDCSDQRLYMDKKCRYRKGKKAFYVFNHNVHSLAELNYRLRLKIVTLQLQMVTP